MEWMGGKGKKPSPLSPQPNPRAKMNGLSNLKTSLSKHVVRMDNSNKQNTVGTFVA